MNNKKGSKVKLRKNETNESDSDCPDLPDLTCDSDFESDMEDENPSVSFPAMQQYSFVFENSSSSQTLSHPREVQGATFLKKKTQMLIQLFLIH